MSTVLVMNLSFHKRLLDCQWFTELTVGLEVGTLRFGHEVPTNQRVEDSRRTRLSLKTLLLFRR